MTTQKTKIYWLDWPALIVFTALMLVVFIQFFTRYALNDSWSWTEEIARYLLIALVFSGSLSVVYRGEHIALDVVYRLVNRANTKPLLIFSQLLSILYYLFLGIVAFLLAHDTHQNLVSIALPKFWIYGFIAVTLLLCAATSVYPLIVQCMRSSQEIYTHKFKQEE